jgi:regulator of sigma E protease
MSLVIAIFGLAFLILVHEAGHFFVARLVGMRPTRFYIGFPPALAKVKRNGIEYGIGAIPLGGYVKIPGMHRPSSSDVDVHLGAALGEAPQLYGPVERLKRSLAEGGQEASDATAELEESLARARLSPGAKRAAERGIREIQESLSPQAYWRQRVWKRILVIFAGPGTNLLFAIVLFAALFMAGGGKATSTVGSVLKQHPAAKVGLEPGDRIVKINGHPVTPPEIPQRIKESQGHDLRLLVKRGNQKVLIGPVRAHKDKDRVYRLGFTLKGEEESPPDAAWHSIRLTGRVTKQIFASLGHLFQGQGRKDIASPVGIVQGSSSALSQGVENYLWVLGLISLSLALLNLLPLLPLDGGHIAFSIAEGIRGRAVKKEVYERVSAVGIFLVVLLFFVGLSNDIGRLGGG